jgi:sarcosine oxidase subunit alpha
MRIKEHPILGRLKEGRRIHIYLDGRRIPAYEGEPVAVSLLANGIFIHGRRADGSMRALFCARGVCTDCIMEVEGEGNVPVCTYPAMDGLKIFTKQDEG